MDHSPWSIVYSPMLIVVRIFSIAHFPISFPLFSPEKSTTMKQNQLQDEQHLFDDFHHRVTQASPGKRFANYLIDVTGFCVFLFVIFFLMFYSGMEVPSFFYKENGKTFNLLGQ